MTRPVALGCPRGWTAARGCGRAAALLGRGPADYHDSFPLMAEAGTLDGELAGELAPSVGLRNLLTHQDVALDPAVVVRGIPLALVSYRRYLAAVAALILR